MPRPRGVSKTPESMMIQNKWMLPKTTPTAPVKQKARSEPRGIEKGIFVQQTVAGHLLCAGFEVMSIAEHACLHDAHALEGRQTSRTHAVGQVTIHATMKNKAETRMLGNALGMGEATVTSKVVRESHTERMTSE